MPESVEHLWGLLSELDSTINFQQKHTEQITRRRLNRTSYNRETLFHNMTAGRISLFYDYPTVLKRGVKDKRTALLSALQTAFPKKVHVRVRMGPSDSVKYRTVRDIVDSWYRGKSVLGITDLHVRDTPVEKIMDVAKLSKFNLLCEGTDSEAEQEMMTMVISSSNNVTDSHSDDPDGSNHCFLGKKVWLMWDTFEGLQRGLEDVERMDVQNGQAAFDIETFLSLRTSKWLVVQEGDTLFLPGSYTHKVFTINRYLGVGSFYVSIPNCLRTLSRWIKFGPLWSINDPKGENEDLVDRISQTAAKKIERLRRYSTANQERWGYDYIEKSVKYWNRQEDVETRNRLLSDARFNRYALTVMP